MYKVYYYIEQAAIIFYPKISGSLTNIFKNYWINIVTKMDIEYL